MDAFRRAGSAALSVLLCGCSSVFFAPSRRLYARPETFALRYETVTFPSSDGTLLTGLLLKTSSAPARATVLHFHGNGENMTSHFRYSDWLTSEGYDVFIFDYRGYGASAGKPSLAGAVEDGVAALRYLRRRADLDAPRLAVWGQSLGGALAVAALASDGGDGVHALILESAFDSYRAIARDVLSRNILTRPLRTPLAWLLVDERHDPAHWISRLPRIPTLVIHGDLDDVVPLRLGERLYAELGEPKEFWRVPGANHLETFTRLGPLYRPRLVRFLDAALSRPRP